MKKIEDLGKRKVPVKNYLILILIGILVVLLTLYINEWIKTYNENKISVSVLRGKVSEINFSEIELVLNESRDVVLYVSYTNDKNIYDKEVKLLKKLKSKDMMEYVMYLNVDEYLNNNEYLNILKAKFPNIEADITKAPLFIYIKNGKGIMAINSDSNVVDDSDFIQIMETYEIKD